MSRGIRLAFDIAMASKVRKTTSIAPLTDSAPPAVRDRMPADEDPWSSMIRWLEAPTGSRERDAHASVHSLTTKPEDEPSLRYRSLPSVECRSYSGRPSRSVCRVAVTVDGPVRDSTARAAADRAASS